MTGNRFHLEKRYIDGKQAPKNLADANFQMTAFFSEKLRIISFIAILFVLYIHAGYPDEVNENMTVPVAVRTCIVGVFSQGAVPMFYFISGFLFFYGIKNGISDVFKKVKKRIKTLLFPYVIAALFFPLFFVVLEFIPGASVYINSSSYADRFSSLSLLSILSSLFFDSGNGTPWAYHLWFLRDLIIIVALTPALYYIRKWTGPWSIAVVLALHLLFPQLKFTYGMFWFIFGSWVLGDLHNLPRRAFYLMFVVFIIMSSYRQFNPHVSWKYFRIIEESLCVCSAWGLYDVFVSKKFRLATIPLLQLACQFTFFLYLYHEPAFHIVVKGIPLVLGRNEFSYTAAFMLSPLVFAPFLIAVGYFLRKYTPAVYEVIAGGR